MKANLCITVLLFFGGLYNLYSQSSHWPGRQGDALPLKDLLLSSLFVLGFGLLCGALFIAICWLYCRITKKRLSRRMTVHLLLIFLGISALLFLWMIPSIV